MKNAGAHFKKFEWDSRVFFEKKNSTKHGGIVLSDGKKRKLGVKMLRTFIYLFICKELRSLLKTLKYLFDLIDNEKC